MIRVLASDVIAAVAAIEGVTETALLMCRDHPMTHARQRAMFVIRIVRPDLSFQAISRRLGRADHTTALHGVREVERRMAADPAEAAKVEALLNAVQPGGDIVRRIETERLTQRQAALKAELTAVERRLAVLQSSEQRAA